MLLNIVTAISISIVFEQLKRTLDNLISANISLDQERESLVYEIQQRIEHELEQQVREALETPPLERMQRNRHKAKLRRLQQDQKHDEKRDR